MKNLIRTREHKRTITTWNKHTISFVAYINIYERTNGSIIDRIKDLWSKYVEGVSPGKYVAWSDVHCSDPQMLYTSLGDWFYQEVAEVEQSLIDELMAPTSR